MRNNTTQCQTFINVHKIELQQGLDSHCQHRFTELQPRQSSTVLPPTLLHFTQPSFQPYRNYKSATCWSCHRSSPFVPKMTWSPATQFRRLAHLVNKTQVCQCLFALLMIDAWFLLSLTSFPLYMSWHRAQPSCPFTKWTLGSRRLNSTCSWLNHWFSTHVSQCTMWSTLIHLFSMSCSTLHHSLRLSACCCATFATVSEVPKLANHVFLVAPDSSTTRDHMVQVFQECLFGSVTLWHYRDHSHTYKFSTSDFSHFSCMHANKSL